MNGTSPATSRVAAPAAVLPEGGSSNMEGTVRTADPPVMT
ncbi:hypothetical protein QFZ32_000292 [Streptomyces canus]|nr:hypothetical protein [Streptomyces canus]MDQ1064853.1 hypothetical protein [Streptomyces canus]